MYINCEQFDSKIILHMIDFWNYHDVAVTEGAVLVVERLLGKLLCPIIGPIKKQYRLYLATIKTIIRSFMCYYNYCMVNMRNNVLQFVQEPIQLLISAVTTLSRI